MNLSVGIITYNEEENLPRTLHAVKSIADEIVIVDSGSSDRTVEIAESFNARIFKEEWKGFGPQKNSVIEKCNGRWVLLIDADEEVSVPLLKAIKEIVSDPAPKNKVYKIRFKSICFGKEINYGGWSNFYRIRLFMKETGKYDDKKVHETFITSENIFPLKEYVFHYTYKNLEEYFEKFNLYTSKQALDYYKVNKRKSLIATYLNHKSRFFINYYLKLGILDGYEGYLLAKTASFYNLIKYSKLREIQKEDL